MDNFVLLLAMNDSLKYLTIKITSSNLCILIFRNILHLKKQKRKKETKINQTNKMLSLKTKVSNILRNGVYQKVKDMVKGIDWRNVASVF